MIHRPITHKDREAYRIWDERLRLILQTGEMLQKCMGRPAEDVARRQFHDAARSIDKIKEPEPWRSWEDLGNAIHGRKRSYRPRAW